jgi:hypothetical protein
MKLHINKPTEIDVRHVLVSIPLRYDDEDSMPKVFPLRSGDTWLAKIDLETGRIVNWPEESTGKFQVHEKVVDAGSYALLDDKDQQVASLQDYVPNSIIPGSFGDYVEIEIENGVITNWRKPDADDIREAFFKDED